MQTQRKELSFKGENIYVGIDVHAKSWKITIATEHLVHKSFVMPPVPDKLLEYLQSNYPDGNYLSAYEAGFCGVWIHYRLLALGINNIVVNPADIPTTQKEITQKEDSRDSRKIARSLQNSSLSPVYVLQQDSLYERSVIRFRAQITKDLRRYKSRLKGYLYFYGIEYPPQFLNPKTHWSAKFVAWLESVCVDNASGKMVLDSLLGEVKNLRKSLLNINLKVRHLSKSPKYKESAELLMGIPGLGLITTMTLLTELEDINRFSNFDNFCSFIGLIPSTCSSGEKDKTRGITFRGHRLRTYMVESSWTAARLDPALSISYMNYCKRMEPNKAIIRIARKLLSRIYSVLKSRKPYTTGRVA